MTYVDSEENEMQHWVYELAIGDDGVVAGIRDLTPGEAYGAILLPTDDTQHGYDFRKWNHDSIDPVVDPNDIEKKRLIRRSI